MNCRAVMISVPRERCASVVVGQIDDAVGAEVSRMDETVRDLYGAEHSIEHVDADRVLMAFLPEEVRAFLPNKNAGASE